MNKIIFSWTLCVLALVGLLVWLGAGVLHGPNNAGEQGLFDTHYVLQSAKGPITEKNFVGHYQLIYFGYTHCPDICPTTLLLVQNALTGLSKKASQVTPVFITIDPERDTPKVMAEYAAHFGKNVVGLSGTPAQIKAVADHFHVYYARVNDEKSALGYTMDHSGFLYLIGPDGTYLTHFSGKISEQGLQEGLNQYVH